MFPVIVITLFSSKQNKIAVASVIFWLTFQSLSNSMSLGLKQF